MNNFLLLPIGLVFILIIIGFILLFQHVEQATRKSTFTLPPLESAKLGIKIIDLSREKTIYSEPYAALAMISIFGSLIILLLGAGTVEYFINNSHLMGQELFIGLVTIAVLIFLAMSAYILKNLRSAIKAIALYKVPRTKELIFKEDKLLFSIALAYPLTDEVIGDGKPYLEMPYAGVKEIQVLPVTYSAGTHYTYPARFKFILQNKEEHPMMIKYIIGENEAAIVEEFRKRFSAPMTYIDKMPDS